MNKDRNSIRWKLLSIVLIPTIFLGIVLIIYGVFLIYGYYAQSIHDEVKTATYILKGCFDLTVRGDYSCENGILKKGDVNITDSTMLYDIKEESQIDTTIFWKDTRVLTTVENEYGVSAVGTKAENDNVIQTVLEKGENYFSKNIIIDGRKYIGYYTPLKNEDQKIVGMVFAGKPVKLVYKKIGNVILWFLGFSVIAVMIATIISKRFSQGLIVDIGLIKKYLHTIAHGDLTATIDERITKRQDEIGEIGIYADKMCDDLKKMVELDPLTSLYNRRSCNNRIQTLVKENNTFTIVMCDIDWFKKVNDQYGHDCGDYILVQISEILNESVQNHGFASRWGGEEFLLIYELDFEEVVEKVKVLLEQIRNYEFQYNGQKMEITMTFGIQEMKKGADYEEVIKIADDKLYRGKRSGRNQIVF